MKKNVFISHSSKNRNDANKVCNYLEKNGISAWIAPRDILPGKSYAAAIVEAIKMADVILLLFTKDSYESIPVRREIERAGSYEKKILNLRLDNTELDEEWEYLLGSIHWLDASDLTLDEILPQTLEATKANLNVPQTIRSNNLSQIKNTHSKKKKYPHRKRKNSIILFLALIIGAGLITLFLSEITAKAKNDKQHKSLIEISQTNPQPTEQKTNNNINTQNTIQYSYGLYDGEIKDGKAHGYGTLTYSKRTIISEKDIKERYATKGQYITGKYENGNLIIGKLFNADGSLSQIISIGK